MKLEFTPDELKGYFNGDTRHIFYEEAVEIAKKLAVHVTGEYPCDLLDERRPHEPIEVKDYRKKIWVPITKPIMSKVITSLSKIRRSADWSINFEDEAQFSKVPDGEKLSDYINSKFPYFTSLTNWVFDVYLRKYATDSNCVVAVLPLEEAEENEYLKPFPAIFTSDLVLDFVQEDYAVLQNPAGALYRSGKSMVEGESYFIATTETWERWDQINGRREFQKKYEYNHGLGILPVFKAGGIMINSKNTNYLYESRLSAMLPHLDEAAREYSDLQASIVLHLYPERWEYAASDCVSFNGTGKCRPQGTSEITQCSECNGYGKKLTSPYGKILIFANEAGQNPPPSPPAGFVEKDVEIISVQDKRIEAHKYAALAAINMEFLAKTPLSESGIAKEVDRDELNNFVNSIAEDVIRMMDSIIWVSALFRYRAQHGEEEIKKMLPMIPVPEKFDMLSSRHLEEEMKSAKDNKLNPLLLNAIEIDYAGKKFSTDPNVKEELLLILQLDPLPNVSEDDKMLRLSQGGITKETYIISSNIHEFVQRAIQEDPTFPDKDIKEQKAKIKSYASAQAQAETAKAKVLQSNELAVA
jgi:hypothetical protein